MPTIAAIETGDMLAALAAAAHDCARSAGTREAQRRALLTEFAYRTWEIDHREDRDPICQYHRRMRDETDGTGPSVRALLGRVSTVEWWRLVLLVRNRMGY